jgi:lipopolysaccharide/colanic/teichoic acid biosynthesis glycosyltransferase
LAVSHEPLGRVEVWEATAPDLAPDQLAWSKRRATKRAREPSRDQRAHPLDEAVRRATGDARLRDQDQPGEVLPRPYFLRQLRREKRRTDRTKAPLSLALFHFDAANGRALGQVAALLAVLREGMRETDVLGRLEPDVIAVLLPDTSRPGTEAFVRKIAQRAVGLSYSSTTGTYPDHLFESLATDEHQVIDFHPLYLDGAADARRPGYRLKRSIDVVGALVGLLVCAPIMLAALVAVIATSTGPAIFRQVRIGRRGLPFVFYKFRSMITGADDRIHRDFVDSLIKGEHESIDQGGDAGPAYKLKSDPRVTRVGEFLRKTSIDELPQLFNVLKGDMSLVGPRPPLPYEVEKYQSWHLRRTLEVRPGITGLWQVEGRSRTTFDEMVRLDLRYIRTCSLFVDLKILLKTVVVVLRQDGAS